MDTKWSVYTKDIQGPTLCGKIVMKLTPFYVESMLPELMTHRLQSTPSEDVASTSTCSVPTLYCSCRDKEHGKMIECENPMCKYEWYHYSCIGMKRAPNMVL